MEGFCYRCILAYFMEENEDDLPYLEVPMHTLIKLEPRAYGCDKSVISLPVDCVSTHRPKPEVPGFLEKAFRREEPEKEDCDTIYEQ